MDRSAIEALARRLRSGQSGALTAAELDAVLSWLGGGQRHGALQLTALIGRPDQKPETVAALYRWLDRLLLGQGDLDPVAAHLDARRPEADTKARFRRLIQAFHPDRYPELASWLTPRSQLIHGAYAAFKRRQPWGVAAQSTASDGLSLRPKTGSPPSASGLDATVKPAWSPGPIRHSARVVPESSGPLQNPGRLLRHAPSILRLLIGATAAIVLIPLIIIYWTDEGTHAAHPVQQQAAVQSQPTLERSRPVDPVAAPALVVRPENASLAAVEAPPMPRLEQDMNAVNVQSDMAAELEANRARIDQFLQRFGQYVNHGDLEGLLQLAEPAAPGSGSMPLAQRYGPVIAQSRRRHQEFQVLSIEQHGADWSVQALSRLTMAFDDLTARHEELRLQIILRQEDDGQLRITRFDG